MKFNLKIFHNARQHERISSAREEHADLGEIAQRLKARSPQIRTMTVKSNEKTALPYHYTPKRFRAVVGMLAKKGPGELSHITRYYRFAPMERKLAFEPVRQILALWRIKLTGKEPLRSLPRFKKKLKG